MKRSTRIFVSASAALVACFFGVALSGNQAPPAKLLMAEQVFKNIQVHKGIPVDEFMLTMVLRVGNRPQLHRLSRRGKRRQLVAPASAQAIAQLGGRVADRVTTSRST